MRKVGLIAMLLPMAACAAPAAQTPTTGVCNAEPVQRFCGMAASAETGMQLLAGSGAATLRWIAQGSMVTMEFRTDRLSVGVTADNKIETVRCG